MERRNQEREVIWKTLTLAKEKNAKKSHRSPGPSRIRTLVNSIEKRPSDQKRRRHERESGARFVEVEYAMLSQPSDLQFFNLIGFMFIYIFTFLVVVIGFVCFFRCGGVFL